MSVGAVCVSVGRGEQAAPVHQVEVRHVVDDLLLKLLLDDWASEDVFCRNTQDEPGTQQQHNKTIL